MRVLVTCFAALGLLAGTSAMAAGGSGDPSASNAPATSNSTAPSNPAPAASPIESELQQMRDLLQQQSAELQAQQKKMEALEEELKAAKGVPLSNSAVNSVSSSNSASPEISANAPAAPAAMAAAPSAPIAGTNIASGTEAIGAAFGAESHAQPQGATPGEAIPTSPLQLRIGDTYLTPVGFMDFTTVYRNNANGGSIGTSFGSIGYGNVLNNHLSEWRQSMQNSRIGFRFDSLTKGFHVIGYMEADFLGQLPTNVAVSSNSNTLRSRVYWLDLRKGAWEVLGGQTWSLITPGRVGISPIPGDIFYTDNIDVNYQLGLFWGRIPELRVVYHPTNKIAFAVALDNPEQYIGGSSGGSTITLPSAYVTPYTNTELNAGTSTTSVPNVAPDVIAKLAFDPSSKFHFEVGGVERQFKLWSPVNSNTYSATGGGGFLNLNVQVFKGFRLLTNNFWSDGGGRYIFGQAPDLVVEPNGAPKPLHSGSTVTGFEFTQKNTTIYGYYGALYVDRATVVDTTNKNALVGYGYTGSPNAQNRAVQEATFGFSQNFWKNPRYGAVTFMAQYSYLTRNPWYVAAGQPANADVNMFFLDLRYTLPGSAPTIGH